MLPPCKILQPNFNWWRLKLDKSLENFVVAWCLCQPAKAKSKCGKSVENWWQHVALKFNSTNQWIFCKIYLVKIFSWVPKLGKLLTKVKVSAKQCKSQVKLWQISALSDRPSEFTKMLHGINLIICNSNSMNCITCFNLESHIDAPGLQWCFFCHWNVPKRTEADTKIQHLEGLPSLPLESIQWIDWLPTIVRRWLSQKKTDKIEVWQ